MSVVDRINSIRERLEKATPGRLSLGMLNAALRYARKSSMWEPNDFEDGNLSWPTEPEDATLFAHAPSDLKLLLDIVEKQKKALSMYANADSVAVHFYNEDSGKMELVDKGEFARACLAECDAMAADK